MDSVREWLLHVETIAGVKGRKALSELLEIKYETMNTWIKKGSITATGIFKITGALPISRTYLETGAGSPHLDQSGNSNYGHSELEERLLQHYRLLDNETQEHVFHIVKRLSEWATDPKRQVDEGIDYKV